jgi:hypothetical protein
MEKTVRIYDVETKRLTTIPASELAPGMVRVRDTELGEVWIEVGQAKLDAPYRHPPFTEEDREKYLKPLQETFKDVYPCTLEEWEANFRREQNIEREIATWLVMRGHFKRFTEGRDLAVDQRQDIFQVILACVNNGPDHVLATVSARTLSRKRVKEIVEVVCKRKGKE